MRILITGATGHVGRHIWRGLEADHELRLGARRVPEGDPRWVRLDVTPPTEVMAAMTDIEAVIHLAVATGHEGDYEEDTFNQQRFDVNVRGTWNVLEAARRAGVRRVVHTSSIMVVWDYPPPQLVPGDAPPRPLGTYALTKQMGETLCRYYAAAGLEGKRRMLEDPARFLKAVEAAKHQDGGNMSSEEARCLKNLELIGSVSLGLARALPTALAGETATAARDRLRPSWERARRRWTELVKTASVVFDPAAEEKLAGREMEHA